MDYSEYLAKLKEENKSVYNTLFAECKFCGEPSETIESDGYKIYPVCKNHIKE